MYKPAHSVKTNVMKREEKRRVVIIGAGPAGLCAGIYAARAGLEPLIIENATIGGQLSSSAVVENYPGFPSVTGTELAAAMRSHAERQGVRIEQFDPFIRAELSAEQRAVETENCRYLADAVIVAAGRSPVRLPAEIEGKYRSRGVHYCALCDGSSYRGRDVGVVGGGSAALEDALYLAEICSSVTVIRRGAGFKAEQKLISAAESHPKIKLLYNTDLVALGGSEYLEYAETEHGGVRSRIPLAALFCRLGSVPSGAGFPELRQSENGFILTDDEMRTNIPFVYAAGDIRSKRYRQIITAAADGAIAALTAERDLARLAGRKGD